MPITRRNHYVPQWYQERFLSSPRSAFHYLDLCPPVINLPDGRKKSHNAIKWPCSPSQCFWYQDLYTTHHFGFLNDEIERYLFGKIDGLGAKAVHAMAEQEFESLHDNFQNFFEYLDSQKIRTPKGLAWIKSKYPNLTHNQLLLEMQHLRRLHCTLWFEAVREIVSAKSSAIKFIVSDHPVTIYNPACPPSSHECVYPNDPRIEMKATQTIFPLDSNRCLILTNLDYARNPDLPDPKAYRPNANPFRQTLARMDNTICCRELKENDVAAINFIIKSRAKQFLAAEKKDWLYPEKVIGKSSWKDIGKSLLPPENKLYHFGGEVYVGYQDGSSSYHDEYGRTHAEPDYLKKEPVKGKVGTNDSCPCGSGKKFKKCCRDKPEDERPSSTYRSIRERNIKFLEILIRILDFDKGKTWTDVRRSLTDNKIADIHKAVAALWPLETDLMSLLPRPDAKISRMLYSGLLDPQVAYQDVSALSFYTDEILIINPFPNPNIIRKEYNPIDNPSQYRQETLKNIIFVIAFMPLIQSGRVNLIPDPMTFNRALRDQVFEEAKKRRDHVKLDNQATEPLKKLAMENFKRFIFNAPDERLRQFIKKATPQISDEDLAQTMAYIKHKNEEDPFSMIYPEDAEIRDGQLFMSHLSPNLELGMFLAQATGSFIVTNHPYRWSEICSSVKYFYGKSPSPWKSIADRLTNFDIDFIHFLDPADFRSALNDGHLQEMRTALRNIWNAVQTEQPDPPSQVDDLLVGLNKAKENMDKSIDWFMQKKNEGCTERFRVVRTKAKLNALIAPAGHSTGAVYRLLLAHAGHEKYLKALPFSLYIEHVEQSNA